MSEKSIKKVCVIGAGTMGAGIAAQIANAGVPVLLLDILPKEGDNRNAVAEGAVAKMLKTQPAPFMGKRAAKLVETGNIEDDLGKVAECDWVVEAIIERLDIKQDLYAKLEEVRTPGTAVSSNTSTIPLAQLTDGRSDQFKQDFLITHFFNPPRYMRLIEIVAGPQSNADTVDMVSDFVDRKLGKTVVDAEDSPGFIANRVGTFWIQQAVNSAFDLGITVEEADEIGGRPMGVPKTGLFGLIDLIGIDLMPHLMKSLTSTLPADDWYQKIARSEPLIEAMIKDGYTGRKGLGGFYRINRDGGGKVKEAKDLKSGEYRAAARPGLVRGPAAKGDLKALISAKGKVGDYAWAVLGPTLSYAASIVPEATATIVGVDDAMKLGYNWKRGPFEMIDAIGAAHLVERLKESDYPVPAILEQIGDRTFYRVQDGKRQYFGTDGEYHDVVRPEGVLLLEDIKLTGEPLIKNGSAALWDLGDGVVALEFTGKMNALDEQVMRLIQKAIPLVKKDYKALVVYNEGSNFSAGANLGLALFALNIAAWGEVEKSVKGGQAAYKALKYAPFPVVSAPFGLALGGGCEVCLNSDAIQAHAETYIGLVETGVGIIPGWGGCGEMISRWEENPRHPNGPMPAVSKSFELISTATVAKSAAEAKDHGFLRRDDGITMNRDRLLYDAKQRALAMVDGYEAPEKPEYRLPGPTGAAALKLAVDSFRKQGLATEHDETVAHELAYVLTGGDTDMIDVVTEDQMLKFEAEAFMRLVRNPKSQARVEHMLETGKPLRN
ncbi:3-hydroxyacyl-CoA dehydrogenase/enoyl-CoA hydratase family protein [Aurantiacibacter gangjinensis]|uniref:3-hydroxyacyl-CoA dehydrogenase n=1 Tax=Aurantiacibacter gangjinensis TaxID=502682 RepID=A0A0G9MPJ9_9SPHN|nr:3-hydroxyacyl-CoA dehydrogenase/enoyl-CoA hydratase family protein [Aurantiacibacter gangjinensis]APE28421.1 Enoyl-CoA hydratase [isoleucine degradation] / 3-hydroxyacyl-CoA dehydrogenase [Aurantiacibacter gangjinensis]KLE32642.1 3-hydroxyacyl-CoA dehydrogenase [Aurantiacibacter gangjinensis]